jgi:hypothetical protein
MFRATRSFPPKPGKNTQKPGKTGQFEAQNRAKNRALRKTFYSTKTIEIYKF